MRPITKPASNSHYNPPTSLDIGGRAGVLLHRLAGTASPRATFTINLSRVLDLLLENAQGVNFPGFTKAEQDVLVAGLMTQITRIYKTAAAPLTKDLGAFCSYCGSNLPGLIEVEHTVPKVFYPTFATDWDCFLLSCGPCNTSKGNNPKRADATSWSRLVAPTEQELYDEIRGGRYLWPDRDHTCWQDLPLQLEYFDTVSNDWVPLSIPEDTDLDNVLTAYDVINHTVLADICVGGSMKHNVQVAVTVQGSAGKPWTDDMIELMQFNDDVVNPGTGTYDRRQMNRTRAWFDALGACRLLTLATDQAAFDLLWQQVPMMGASSGFYSVWVTVLERFSDFTGARYASRFVAETNDPLYYPHTSTTHLPH
ncbi:hypothetical protein [Pseudomonas koreensis]|uniref:HNH endonuclease n=1 Tax=Pseudomonas koreensis TaxID=198620 RepID=A0A9X3BBV5_9PSED|nr:hypothetical protein [Pseudomonas koreensis]MCU7247443.1 hypothetical protein [Pseudomonas koreensis]